MTAVVQTLPPRNGWSNGLDNMSTDSRIFVPRKSAQRSNSTSSLSSSASNISTTTTSSFSSTTQSHGQPNGDASHSMSTRKKGPRGIWPANSKPEPAAGAASVRSQLAATANPASSVGGTNISQQPQNHGLVQQNAITHGQTSETTTLLQLQPLNGTFERKSVTIPNAPDVLRIGRQTNQKTLPTPSNGYFDSKVLSRQHAEVWSDRDGKISIRDVGSSNGTFVNGKRLSLENKPSETERLKEGDILELGIDIVSEDQKTVVHHKVAARVDYAGLQTIVSNDSTNFADLDPTTLASHNGRARTQSQGANGNGKYTGVAISNVPVPYHAKWLQPVTMEQIVKKLSVELRQARDQSSDIHSRNSVTGAMIQDRKVMPLSPAERLAPISNRPADSHKLQFSAVPPAPPPSQPLPDAPKDETSTGKTTELPSLPPILYRSDTEKPKPAGLSMNASSSPVKPDQSGQILNLVDALSTAQKEIAAQNQRLNEMEHILGHERESRKLAEERALTLASSASMAPLDAQLLQTVSSTGMELSKKGENSGSELLERISLMRHEMDEMKLLMATYRHRAETAEEESSRDRQTLANMVESLRRREQAAERKEQRQRSQNTPSTTPGEEVDEVDNEFHTLDVKLKGEIKRAEDRLQSLSKAHAVEITNGTAAPPIHYTPLEQLGKAAISAAIEGGPQRVRVDHERRGQSTDHQAILTRRRQDQLSQTAPYASLIGVVLLGVGMMAYLNNWQKVTDR